MLEPLGQSQVLAYLKVLSKKNKIFILSFEKKDDFQNNELREQINNEINNLEKLFWIPIKYHKYPVGISTLWDIILGIINALKIIRINRIDIIHSRSFVPGIIAFILKFITKVKFIFDIRGFWVDEKVNSGNIIESGVVYKLLKQVEQLLFIHSDHIVTLTKSAKNTINTWTNLKLKSTKCTIIPTCVDTNKFYIKDKENNQSNYNTLGVIGNVSGWALFDPIITLYKELLSHYPTMRLKILTQSNNNLIKTRLLQNRINLKQVTIDFVNYKDIPQEIQSMDLGVFFYKNSFSEKGRSPTKLAEFLACGKPVIINKGIGDTEEIINNNDIGVVVKGIDIAFIRPAVGNIIELLKRKDIANKCRMVAVKKYSLNIGVRRYQEIYNEI